MKVGDLVTWKCYMKVTEYGVVIGKFEGRERNGSCWWVKFINGSHSHRRRTLCQEQHIKVVEDIK